MVVATVRSSGGASVQAPRATRQSRSSQSMKPSPSLSLPSVQSTSAGLSLPCLVGGALSPWPPPQPPKMTKAAKNRPGRVAGGREGDVRRHLAAGFARQSHRRSRRRQQRPLRLRPRQERREHHRSLMGNDGECRCTIILRGTCPDCSSIFFSSFWSRGCVRLPRKPARRRASCSWSLRGALHLVGVASAARPGSDLAPERRSKKPPTFRRCFSERARAGRPSGRRYRQARRLRRWLKHPPLEARRGPRSDAPVILRNSIQADRSNRVVLRSTRYQ